MKDYGTLDDILCDPDLADRLIRSRGAWHLVSRHWNTAGVLSHCERNLRVAAFAQRFFTTLSLNAFEARRELRSCTNAKDISDSPGLYLITGGTPQKTTYMYAGSALNLQRRLSKQFASAQLEYWEKNKDAESVSFLCKPEVTNPIDLLSMQKRLIQLARPKLNLGSDGGMKDESSRLSSCKPRVLARPRRCRPRLKLHISERMR